MHHLFCMERNLLFFSRFMLFFLVWLSMIKSCYSHFDQTKRSCLQKRYTKSVSSYDGNLMIGSMPMQSDILRIPRSTIYATITIALTIAKPNEECENRFTGIHFISIFESMSREQTDAIMSFSVRAINSQKIFHDAKLRWWLFTRRPEQTWRMRRGLAADVCRMHYGCDVFVMPSKRMQISLQKSKDLPLVIAIYHFASYSSEPSGLLLRLFKFTQNVFYSAVLCYIDQRSFRGKEIEARREDAYR